MQIRSATAADVPAVLPMVEKLAKLHERWDAKRYDYKPNTDEMYSRWLAVRASDPRSVFLVADHQRLLTDVPFVVGFLIGTVEENIPIYRTPRFGFIHDVWIEGDYRNEGIGRQITMLALEKFREIGVKQVRLETAGCNEPAQKLFVRCGFRVVTHEMLAEV